jgi:hypothetical protein
MSETNDALVHNEAIGNEDPPEDLTVLNPIQNK